MALNAPRYVSNSSISLNKAIAFTIFRTAAANNWKKIMNLERKFGTNQKYVLWLKMKMERYLDVILIQ